jgi:hypothetical protein
MKLIKEAGSKKNEEPEEGTITTGMLKAKVGATRKRVTVGSLLSRSVDGLVSEDARKERGKSAGQEAGVEDFLFPANADLQILGSQSLLGICIALGASGREKGQEWGQEVSAFSTISEEVRWAVHEHDKSQAVREITSGERDEATRGGEHHRRSISFCVACF